MKTASLFATALCAAATLLSQPSFARDLTVVGFGGAGQDAMREVFFKPFTAQTGLPVAEESWDGGVGVLRAKVEGGNAPWDVVQMDSSELAVGCEEGLYETLDFSKIGGADAYLPFASSTCGVGVIVYDYVLAYDGDKLKDGPKSWADFFDTKKFPGKRALRQGPQTNLEIALMADGVPLKDVYSVLGTEQGVTRALRKLDTIKNDLVFWKAGAQPPQLLASNEVVMTSAYNGRISAANEKDHRNFKLLWNQAIYVLDSWAILKGSPNVDKAYQFLNFVGKPDVQKALPDHISYGITSVKGSELLAPEKLANLPSAPQNLAVALPYNASFWLEHTDRLTARFNNWASQN